MDRVSPYAAADAGFASALLDTIGGRPWTGFWLFAAAHASIWTILPFALYANLPLDIIEALTGKTVISLRRRRDPSVVANVTNA
jgi:hypothetical protein